MDEEVIEVIKKWLTESPCTKIENQSFLSLWFGDKGIHILSAWRLVYNGELIYGSDVDSNIQHTEYYKALAHQKITDFTIRPPFHDLTLTFDNGMYLETFADSQDYESWNFAGKGDPLMQLIVGGPGNLWSGFGIAS